MGLYNFRQRFAPFILSGRKRHTIRARRKNPDVVGNIAHCYTGLRTKHTTLLGRWPVVRVEDIEIEGDEISGAHRVFVAGVEFDESEREKLARLDGFRDFADFAGFWKGRLPFTGQIVHWKFTKGKQRRA